MIKDADNIIKIISTDLNEKIQGRDEPIPYFSVISSVLNATPDFIFYKDYLNRDGAYIGCNDAFAKFSGKSKDQIINKNDIDLFGEELGLFFRDKDREILRLKETKSNEEWLLCPDGKQVLIKMTKSPLYDACGILIGLVGVGHDITQLHEHTKNIENQKKALEDQKELYELVFKNSASSVLIINIEENKFIDCNEPAIDILKCESKADVLSLKPAQLSPEFQPDGRRSDEKSDEMNALAVENGSHTFEWKHLTKTNEEIWIEVVLTPILIDNKKFLHVVWKDIDARKKAEYDLVRLKESLEIQVKERTKELEVELALSRAKDKKLIQHSRLAQMGEMISMIAHQWRQPLAAISTISIGLRLKMELESSALESKEEIKAYNDHFSKRLEEVENFTQVLSTTIDDFRNFYKPNKKAVETSLESVIARALVLVKSSLDSDNIEILSDYQAKGTLELYDNELMQVILNILKNAQDNFNEKNIKNPRIKISTKDNTLFISDNGGGIPENIIDKIFDPYFSTKDSLNGTGLGLYMSKMIVEEHHNGRLSVKNEDDGVCFRLEFNDKI